ncbi:MAG: SMP-30/gluconolactonase/LRE family protein, partial [Ilumatobacteraceae bacterium]
MHVTVDDPSFEALIDPDAPLVKIGEGYQFSEGPVWNQREQALYFSDIPGDARWRWTAGDGMQLAATPTFKGNGLAYDVDGSLLVCEQVSSCLTRIRDDGRRELVAWHLDGVYLNSPNDVVVRAADGSIYFTDPDYGRWNDWIGCKRAFVRDVKGVYRVPPGGGPVELVVEPHEFEQPNGLCFSPDESILYVNDSPRAEIKAFDV